MSRLEEALATGVWAIAVTPGGKYIGQLWGVDHGVATEDKGYFVEHLTNPMRLKWPFEFTSMFIPTPMRMPDGTVQHGFQRSIEAISISHCYDVENLSIVITPVDLIFFKDMEKIDEEWHKNLIRNGIRALLANRFKDAGLVAPDTSPAHMRSMLGGNNTDGHA